MCSVRVSYPLRVQGVSISTACWLCCVYTVGVILCVCVCVRYWIKGEMAGKAIPTPILIREMKQLLE